jgi:hypothetical protein
MFRAQGALEILDILVNLPETIKEYLHDVSTGKVRKIDLREDQHGLARQR